MLSKLSIRNIALAEDVVLEFGGGMNCLTGETGAGKSIIIDSISALLGFRVKKDIVRDGCESGVVRGEFTGISAETCAAVNDVLPGSAKKTAPGDSIVLEREISAAGRHICRVCGFNVNSAGLRRIGETLIDIHGQNDSRLLTDNSAQRAMLDSFAGDNIRGVLEKYKAGLSEYRGLRHDLAALSGSPAERARTIDLLNYQIREIDGAQL
ncbi:MAG: AAA family ATPase, partial [Clostridia bacterium]|nr:AAA family ATPase [Clostridia bacterium]